MKFLGFALSLCMVATKVDRTYKPSARFPDTQADWFLRSNINPLTLTHTEVEQAPPSYCSSVLCLLQAIQKLNEYTRKPGVAGSTDNERLIGQISYFFPPVTLQGMTVKMWAKIHTIFLTQQLSIWQTISYLPLFFLQNAVFQHNSINSLHVYTVHLSLARLMCMSE